MTIMPKPVADASGATRRLADCVARISYDGLDERTRHRAKYHFLDALGACIAGATQDVTAITERALQAGGATGATPVAGRSSRLDMLSAALLLGASGHGLELDDGYTPGSTHPGTVVIPALLAAGHDTDVDGRRIIAATVAGYEVICRLSAAMHPRSRWRGFHNTAITGPLGASAAWGVLKGFDAGQHAHAFGGAASMASGIFSFMHGGDVKRLHPGFAARSGLLAGLLAAEGLEGPKGVIECRDGYFHVFGAGDTEPERYQGLDILAAGRGSPYAITECYIKPYAACRHIHGAVDAVLDIRAKDRVAAADVAGIEVGTYKVAAAHDLKTWDSFTSAQMSIPFVVATALCHGGVDLAHFTREHRTDGTTTGVAGRVATSVDQECDTNFPKARPSRVKVTTRSGAVFERYVPYPYGEPENPLADDALTAKFMGLVTPVLGKDRAERIAADVWSLEKVSSMRDFVEALRA